MADAGAPYIRSTRDPSDSEEITPRPLPAWARLVLVFLYLVPKNALSRLAGRFAALKLPGSLQRAEIRLFARIAGVDLDEARYPVEDYASLQGFFTRELCDGARPIEGDSNSLVAPCDGTWGAAGPIEGGLLIQVKGHTYSVADLLGDAELALRYEGGSFATFYLSPRDYHRFHTPAAGRIARVDYRPGALWPVNEIGLLGIDRLFARNERICAFLDIEDSQPFGAPAAPAVAASARAPAPIAMVAVGATMVGSVRLRFDDLHTNETGRLAERRDFGENAPHFLRGEEWGHFEFGSTIVMLTPPGAFEFPAQQAGQALRLGEVIGRRCSEG